MKAREGTSVEFAADATAADGAAYFAGDQVRAAFARGEVLFDRRAIVNGAVHASRREGPGEAEVHAGETDVMFFQEGGAQLVTGGAVTAPRTIGPGETRGSGIEGGLERSVGPGDVMVIPRGVPHWFREVRSPLTYYTVKIHWNREEPATRPDCGP